MSRYIDADKLLKSAVSKFKCVPSVGISSYRNGEECFDGEDFEELINEAPTADVVEVVRCKDCKYCRTLKDGGSQCERIDGLLMTKPNDYCSYGERSKNKDAVT